LKSLSEWEEEWMAMFKLHSANLVPSILEEWRQEKTHFPKLYNNPNVSLTVVEMCTPKFELHIGMHKEWLHHKAIEIEEPTNFTYLISLTHPQDRIFSLETKIIGYEILMSLSPAKRQLFWMKYHRRFMDVNGDYFFYALHLKVHKFDDNGTPVLIMVETKRLPKKYQPDKIHYREFSHKIKQETKRVEPILKKLSPREQKVLELAYEGFTSSEIALILKISINTVKAFRKKILKKQNVNKMHMAYVVAHK